MLREQIISIARNAIRGEEGVSLTKVLKKSLEIINSKMTFKHSTLANQQER